jgi:MOSC domain-containing protein
MRPALHTARNESLAGERPSNDVMHVSELWRYPVKSMAGERLSEARLGLDGLDGDRLVHAEDADGNVVTARTHPALLGLRAVMAPDGEPRIDARPWSDPVVTARVQEIVGEGGRLVRWAGSERFDVLPLLVATDGALAALGVDHRRLRPNVVIGGVADLTERAWPGRRLRIGAAVIEVASVRRRCVMTTYDPDTQAQDLGVLRRIVREFGGRMALDAAVIEPGRIVVGDPVELLER